MILAGRNFQTLAEVQEHTLYFSKVGKMTGENMFQEELLNPFQKVSTIHLAQQEWI